MDTTTIPCQPYGLADVLCEAPPLFAMLSSQDQAAVSTCSKHLQCLIHSSVTAVVVNGFSDVEAVLRGSWPQLALIMGTSAFKQQLHLPRDSKFQLIAKLKSLSNVAYIVGPSAQADQCKSIAAAFRHLQRWPARHLTATVHSHSEDVIAHIVQYIEPHVKYLELSHNKLGSASMIQLKKGSLPQLASLKLSSTQLDTAAMTALTRGNWPLLKRLDLSSNPLLGPAAVALIPNAAHWVSLRELSLAHIELNSSCLHSVALLHNQLEELNLASANIDAAALSQLTALPWPQLHALDLMSNKLTADAIASLVSADIPKLKHLNVACNQLDTAAAKHISKGTWLDLCSLSLQNNAFDNAAMAFLARGNWPHLMELRVFGNEVCVLGLELLMAGQWPYLWPLGSGWHTCDCSILDIARSVWSTA